MQARRVNAIPAPTHNQLNAAALSKVKHPDAPHQAAALEDELRTHRGELAEMARLLEEDPEAYDRYFDQVAETGEIKQNVAPKVTAKQIPAKKAPAKKVIARKSGNPAKRAAIKKAEPHPDVRRGKVKAIEAAPPAPGQGATVIPVPPPLPGAATIRQED